MFKRPPLEALVWLGGLLTLALTEIDSSHFSICPLAATGWDFCPGCGLGESVALFFRGRLIESIEAHPFGPFAVFVLSFRIVNLTKHYLNYYGKSY
jgi:hypothetical protein